MHLYLATTNAGKLRDFINALTPQQDQGVTLTPLPNLDILPAPDETAETFLGNASLKAIAYSLAAPGLLVLADDSGLEVDALSGAPGVRSARYADDSLFTSNRPLPADLRNNLCLLDALASARAPRLARYQCALALARDGHILATASGSVEGEILTAERGNGGFGYDPLFLLSDEGLTMAEISPELRRTYSHRARALATLLASLPAEL